MLFLKRSVPTIICFIGGIVFLFVTFIPDGNPYKDKYMTYANDWIQIIFGFSIVIAIVSIFRAHLSTVLKQYPGWFYSFVLLFSLVVTALIGFISFGETAKKEEEQRFVVTLSAGRKMSHIDYIYNYVVYPLDAAVFAMLGFYIASAAFTGFRLKNFGSFLLLASAVIVMVGLIPIGAYFYEKIPEVGIWILATPSNAAKRALIFSIAIAGIAFSLKVILGIDKSIYGGTRD
jgi:hypothetical protein